MCNVSTCLCSGALDGSGGVDGVDGVDGVNGGGGDDGIVYIELSVRAPFDLSDRRQCGVTENNPYTSSRTLITPVFAGPCCEYY